MEIDFMNYMKILAISTLTFVIYRLFVEEKKNKTKDHYSRPAWNFFLKKLYARHVINKEKKRQKKILKELKNYENESPKILPNEESSDSQQIYGVDHDGNSLLVKFTRKRHRVAEIWLILRVKNGNSFTTYTLPDHPNTKINNATPRIFEGSDLKLECLAPYSKWRLTYAGMMRKGISHGKENDNNNEDDKNNKFFVRLNFFWTTASDPYFWPFEWSTDLMATALATEQWRDGKWMKLMNLKDGGGYGQFGACKGEVRIYENDYEAYRKGLLPNVQKVPLNLPGIRQRRWGPNKIEHLHRTAVILGSCVDGTVLEIGALSSKFGVTHSQFGSVRAPNGDVLPINWTDFHLASVGEYKDQLPQATIIQISAGDKEFIAVVTFKNHDKVPLAGGSVGEKWDSYIVPVDIVCNTKRGYGVAIFWYPRNESHFELFDEEFPSEIKRIFHQKDKPRADRKVLSFADKDSQSISVAGGKGSSLSILRIIQETKGEQFFDHRSRNFQVLNALVDQFSSQKLKNKLMERRGMIEDDSSKNSRQRSGSITKVFFPDPNDMNDTPNFHVPQGFLISVSAFDEHLKQFIAIRRAIKELENIAYEKIKDDLEEACQRVISAFTVTSLSDDLKQEIALKLRQITDLDENARFAVRSSGITEDTDELSSAGQNQTFLGLRNNEEIFEAIIKCWASLFTYQSVLYRKQNIQPICTSMGVVIQKMVKAQSAGVLFSRHFLNGDPSVIVITANYGLGESVVAGKSEPDTFLVKRNLKNDEVSLLATLMGSKRSIIEMDEEKSVQEVELSEEMQKRFCLNEDVILKLSKIAIVLEKFFGSPRDIEFAVTADKKIYLLQSRSITALNNYTDFEIVHEYDSAIMSPEDVLTKANVGEVLPGAISVLTQSIVKQTIQAKTTEQMGDDTSSSLYAKYFPVTHHHITMDVCKLFLKGINKNVRVMERVMLLSVFGNDIFEIYPNLLDIGLYRNMFYKAENVGLKQLYLFGCAGYYINFYMQQGAAAVARMKLSVKNLSKYKTSLEVVNLIQNEYKNLETVTESHLFPTNNSILYQIITFAILTHGESKMTTNHQRDITLILASIGNIESASIPEMLRDIARAINSTKKSDDFKQVESENGADWLRENCSTAFELFDTFMNRHGHRALKEFDLCSKTWSMQPEKIIDMIKSNLDVASLKTTPKPKLDIASILEGLKTPLSSRGKSFIKRIIPRYHKGVQLREEAKSKLIEAINEMRKIAIYLGEKMVNDGFLPDRELVFHLSLQEIKTVIRTRNSRLINTAIRRQKIFPKLDELRFDEIIFGVPQPLSEKNQVRDEVQDSDILVKGMPVCNGSVTARACVINNFSEIKQLQKGDILITYSTDIGWSPYFNLLSGICTEIGGLISHGAVVARECNLPCIVGASRATEKIKHGEMITLNGDEGIIIRA